MAQWITCIQLKNMLGLQPHPRLPGTHSKIMVEWNQYQREEGPETPSQKTLSESIADSELTHYSRNEQCLASANLWRRDSRPMWPWMRGAFGEFSVTEIYLSSVTRHLVPKWRAYSFQFSIHAEIIGLNKDTTSYKSTCIFFLGSFNSGVFWMCIKLRPH